MNFGVQKKIVLFINSTGIYDMPDIFYNVIFAN